MNMQILIRCINYGAACRLAQEVNENTDVTTHATVRECIGQPGLEDGWYIVLNPNR